MEQLSVPQREVQVRVQLLDEQDLAGIMFVPALGPDGEPGRLIDRLNETGEDFIALREESRTQLVQASQILTVRLTEDSAEEWVGRQLEGSHVGRDLLVKVDLSTGTEVIGYLHYLQPVEHERLVDFLNVRRRFIALRVQKHLVYINRAQVVSARALRGE